MARDKYHPYMVDFPLQRRMDDSGHTAHSIVDFLHPYVTDVQTIKRWAKRGRVPFDVKSMIERGLNRVVPPAPYWTPFDLRAARAERKLSRRFVATFFDISVTSLADWEDRMEVPARLVPDLKKMLTHTLPKQGRHS